MVDRATLKDMETSMEEFRQKINLADSLSILYDNIHFKEVVLKGYLKDLALKLVYLKAHTYNQKDEIQEMIEQQINAISWFQHYLENIMIEGSLAKQSLSTAETEYDTLLGEE